MNWPKSPFQKRIFIRLCRIKCVCPTIPLYWTIFSKGFLKFQRDWKSTRNLKGQVNLKVTCKNTNRPLWNRTRETVLDSMESSFPYKMSLTWQLESIKSMPSLLVLNKEFLLNWLSKLSAWKTLNVFRILSLNL